MTCIECGAVEVGGLDCWGQLGALLALEGEDPELLAEHFLTVATYNLQHSAQFTDEALARLRAAFVARIDEGTGIAELRRRGSRAFEGSRRVLMPVEERRPTLRAWGMTIADVYRPEEPCGSAGRVREWAACVRREM